MRIFAKTRLASLALCAALIGLPAPVFATTAATAPAAESPEGRIRNLHDQLKITPAEEAQWHGVAQVMMDNAAAMKAAVQNRSKMTKGMTAVDDLKSYEAIVDAHADGIKKLAIAFKPLYAAMPPAQQKNADAVFGHRTGAAQVKDHT